MIVLAEQMKKIERLLISRLLQHYKFMLDSAFYLIDEITVSRDQAESIQKELTPLWEAFELDIKLFTKEAKDD